MVELQEFPEDGVEFSAQAAEILAASPWAEEVVMAGLIGLMMDLMDLKMGCPIAGQSVASIEYLKEFAQGFPAIGIDVDDVEISVFRRRTSGWIVYLAIKGMGQLN